jgi:bacteriocin-like protein
MKKISKKDLTKIIGGYIVGDNDASCTALCASGSPITCKGYTCASEDWDGEGSYAGTCSSKYKDGTNKEFKSC